MNPHKSNSTVRQIVYWTLCLFAACVLVSMLSSQRAYARDIVVVQSLDLSGQSNLSKDFSNGIRTYFDAINAKGGVRGRKITFVQLDDSGEAQQTIANLKKLIRENEVDIAIAPTSANSYLAASGDALVRSSGVTLFGAPTGVRPPSDDGARALAIRASYADEARQLLNHISTMRIASVALIQGEGEEAEFAAKAFREEMQRRNQTLQFDGNTRQWQARTNTNASLEAVVISGDAIGVAVALAHARSTAKSATLFGFSMIDHRTLLEIGKTNAIGMVISQAMPSADKTVYPFQREHRTLMKQFRDEPPSLHTLEGYVVARVLVNAFESIPGEPTPASVNAALRSVRDLEFGPMSVSTRVPARAMRFVNLSAVSSKGALIE
jgi:branched-chain amino acid transport system substrate-binding protein